VKSVLRNIIPSYISLRVQATSEHKTHEQAESIQ
jgi:hypothetical protein